MTACGLQVVELLYDVRNASTLDCGQRDLLLRKLKRYIDSRGVLHLVSQGTSSQWQNRQDVIGRFKEVMIEGLQAPRKRIPTRMPRASKENRLQDKHQQSQLKEQRWPVDPDGN